MSLSIVIVNWNSKDLLRDCLISVRKTCDLIRPEIIVVDGGSFDGCAEMLAVEFQDVSFIQSQENIGFGRCNNLGVTHARGEYLLLLNPDTVLSDNAVSTLLNTLKCNSDAGMVGAHLRNSDGTLQWFGIHPLPTPLNCALDSDSLRRRWWARYGPAENGPAVVVEAISGACILIKTETFRKVGGFNPRFFMYGEDMDLCFQVTKLGMKIYYAPDARVIHHGGGSSKNEFSKFSTIMIREALWCYMKMNHGLFTALVYRGMMALSAVFRLAALSCPYLIGSTNGRTSRIVAMKKWWAVLCWAFGAESWARAKFKECLEASDPQALGHPLAAPVSKAP